MASSDDLGEKFRETGDGGGFAIGSALVGRQPSVAHSRCRSRRAQIVRNEEALGGCDPGQAPDDQRTRPLPDAGGLSSSRQSSLRVSVADRGGGPVALKRCHSLECVIAAGSGAPQAAKNRVEPSKKATVPVRWAEPVLAAVIVAVNVTGVPNVAEPGVIVRAVVAAIGVTGGEAVNVACGHRGLEPAGNSAFHRLALLVERNGALLGTWRDLFPRL